jgi:hypothetical protein
MLRLVYFRTIEIWHGFHGQHSSTDNILPILPYADKPTLHFDGWNEIIDKIQDGFVDVGKILEPRSVQVRYDQIRPFPN